jgi:hypothetical protein
MASLPPSPFSFADVQSAETLVVVPGPQASVAAASGPFDSGATVALTLDEAAADVSSQAPAAAADVCEPTSSTGGCQEAPASTSTVTVAAGDAGATDCIGEIFVGARKLEQIPGIFDQAGVTPADELQYVTLKLMDDHRTPDLPDVPQGLIDAIDPLPLFLQAAQ